MMTRSTCRLGVRGMTLLEVVVVVGMLGVFLGLAYEPLLKVLLYPRESQRAFNDRGALVMAERILVENFKKTEKGYLWSRTTPLGTTILMGQSRGFRAADESPITNYVLFRHDAAAHNLIRWELTTDMVLQATTDPPRPNSELSEADWNALAAYRERSLVTTHVTGFVFQQGADDQPYSLDIAVSSAANGQPLKTVHRQLSKGGYDR